MTIVRGLDGMDEQGAHNTTMPLSACSEAVADDPMSSRFPYTIDCVLEESDVFYPTTPKLAVTAAAIKVLGSDLGGD